MRILVTNDDGIHAPGLLAAERVEWVAGLAVGLGVVVVETVADEVERARAGRVLAESGMSEADQKTAEHAETGKGAHGSE